MYIHIYIYIYIYLGALITFPPRNEIHYLRCIVSIASIGFAEQLNFLRFRILRRATQLVARWADQRCIARFIVVHCLCLPSARQK